jgi:hypothetical protein
MCQLLPDLLTLTPNMLITSHDVNISAFFIFSGQFIATIRNHEYSRKRIKVLYPNSDIQGQMNRKSGSYEPDFKPDLEPDLEPDLLEKGMCFSSGHFTQFGKIWRNIQ